MSDKTTVTTATTSTTATTASSVNVTTPSEGSAYTSIQEGAMKLRLKRTKSKTSIDAPEAATLPYIDEESVEEESHSGITFPPSISLMQVLLLRVGVNIDEKIPLFDNFQSYVFKKKEDE